jgi:WD40 repeat protein
MDLSPDERILVTGSSDCTVIIWDLILERTGRLSGTEFSVQCSKRFMLAGHQDAVLSVAIDLQHSTVISTSMDGTIMFFCLRSGNSLIRVDFKDIILQDSVDQGHQQMGLGEIQCLAHQVLVSRQGDVVSFTETRQQHMRKSILHYLHRFDINGRRQQSLKIGHRVTTMKFEYSGKYLIIADDSGLLCVLQTHE